MLRVSPAARESEALSGALHVVGIDPLVLIVLSVLTEVVSADASTATFSSLGSVAPPDQVIEARLALTVLKFKWVKVSTPAGVVSKLVLPGVLRISMIACAETSAASTRLISTGGGLDAGASMAPRLVEVVVGTGNGAESLVCSILNLIAWNCCCSLKVAVLDPPGAAPCCPSPIDKVASAACWAPCSSAIREEEFGRRVTDPAWSTTIVSPGSSATMTVPSLVVISNVPCGDESLYVMAPSSKKASGRTAAWISRMGENARAASVRMPIPPSCAAPRILAKGVSILRPPVFATLPAMKAKAPLLRLNKAEFEDPSQTNSFSAMRALFDRLNAVPSAKVIPTAPSAPVSI